MKESVLHYVWQFKLFSSVDMRTTEGNAVQVIDVGQRNTDAGPDFFNAKVKIGNTLWAGNVEIHDCSSDWLRHYHADDKRYDSVILHVVAKADVEIRRTNGELIPQLELKIPEHILRNIEELQAGNNWIPCGDKIGILTSMDISAWKNALAIERLECKEQEIELLLKQSNNHWEKAFYILLAKAFGFSTNSQPFEQLAKSLDISILSKHKDDVFQLEALLFGQSGLLQLGKADAYQSSLLKEYNFLRAKYRLQPIDGLQWKLLRLRPDNFPHIRIAQFAMLIHRSSKLFSKIIQFSQLEELRQLFDSAPSDYWQTHFLFGKESKKSQKRLGNSSVDILIINIVIPFIFAFHNLQGEVSEVALEYLYQLPSEKNAIIRGWEKLGIDSYNAFDSQALIQLKKVYCDKKKCLKCRFGHKILTMSPR